jgi:hypothetical protein
VWQQRMGIAVLYDQSEVFASHSNEAHLSQIMDELSFANGPRL